MIHSGIFTVVALVEFGLVVFLYLSRRHWKRETKIEYLARRRAELRVDLSSIGALDKPVVPR